MARMMSTIKEEVKNEIDVNNEMCEQVRGMVSEPLQKTFLREKSELKLREKEEVTIILHLLYVHILKLSNQYFFCAGEG